MNIITGRVVADATVKTTGTGKKVVSFSVAHNYNYVKGGEKKVQTTYYDCSLWRSEGISVYLKKGTLVSVNGRTGVNAFINKGGEVKGRLTLTVSEINLLSKSTENRTMVSQPLPASAGIDTTQNDDLPF